MSKRLEIESDQSVQLMEISERVQEVVAASGVVEGLCHVFVPHTTAGVTINEGADPAVARDLLARLDEVAPDDGRYEHREANASGHVKTSLVGNSLTLPIEGGRLSLGRWQAVFFCEFDGPRQRSIEVTVVACG